MKSDKQIEQFIELRATGKSFDTISKEIEVSKPTLINWQKKYEQEISNSQFIRIQSIIEQVALTKQEKIKMLLERQKKVFDELETRDLKDVSIKDLTSIIEVTEKQLKDEMKNVFAFTGNNKPLYFGELEKIEL